MYVYNFYLYRKKFSTLSLSLSLSFYFCLEKMMRNPYSDIAYACAFDNAETIWLQRYLISKTRTISSLFSSRHTFSNLK